jgi:thiol:disulfide interchange protein
MSNVRSWILALLVLAAGLGHAQWKKTPLEAPSVINPNLYKTDANAPREIRDAVATAARQQKNVLLVFGGNWCIDCHVLDRAFHQPRIEPLLQSNFLVVHVDVGRYDKNLQLAKKYHVDLEKGVPSVAVLDLRGALLYSSSEFEKAHLLTEDDVIDFLNRWKPAKKTASREPNAIKPVAATVQLR